MNTTATTTTRAAVLEAYGATPRVREITVSPLGAGQALVRVHASGVNPLDTKIHAGEAAHARHPLPAVLGIDLAGEVEAVGPDVTAFGPGDEVYGMTGGVGGVQGSLAERAVVDVHLLARKPSSLTCARPRLCRWRSSPRGRGSWIRRPFGPERRSSSSAAPEV